MKHIKTANTWNLAVSAQPHIPTLSLSIKISFQTYRGPSAGALLGWRSASFFSHFSTLGTAGLALSADPLTFFKAQPCTRKQHIFWFSLGDVSLDFMTQIGTSMAVFSSFKMVFKQSEMIPIRAMIQVFIFQFNLNSHNAITISLIPNIKQFTFHYTSNN